MRNGYFGIWLSIALVLSVGVGFNILGGIVLVLLYGRDIKGGAPSVIVLVNSFAQVLMMIGLPMLIVRSQEKDFFAGFFRPISSAAEKGSHDRSPLSLLRLYFLPLCMLVRCNFPDCWLSGFCLAGLLTGHAISESAP